MVDFERVTDRLSCLLDALFILDDDDLDEELSGDVMDDDDDDDDNSNELFTLAVDGLLL